MIETKSTVVTFVHISSESSDHYLEVFDGELSEAELRAAVEERCDWEEPELLYIEDSLVVKFNA